MEINPKVSILIPTYNREKIIEDTLKSAISQDYDNIEIIIVDDWSSDKTYNICQEYSKKDNKIKLFRNEENLWPVLNWKKCIDYATWEYVKILFSDDLISNDFVSKTIKLFDIDTAFVFTKTKLFDNEWNESFIYDFNKDVFNSKEYIEKSLLTDWKYPVSPWCALFRRKDILKNLIIDIPNYNNLDFKKFWAWNDLAIFILTAFDYKKIKYIREPLSLFRAHKWSMTCSNDLLIYYETANKFLLDIIKNKKLLNYLKTRIFIYSIWDDKYKKLYKEINWKIDLFYLIKIKYFSIKWILIKSNINFKS